MISPLKNTIVFFCIFFVFFFKKKNPNSEIMWLCSLNRCYTRTHHYLNDSSKDLRVDWSRLWLTRAGGGCRSSNNLSKYVAIYYLNCQSRRISMGCSVSAVKQPSLVDKHLWLGKTCVCWIAALKSTFRVKIIRDVPLIIDIHF